LDEIGLSLAFAASVLMAGFLTLVEFSLLRLKRTRIRELIESESDEDWLDFWLKRSERFWLTSLVVGNVARLTAGITLFVLVRGWLGFGEWPLILLSLAVASVVIITLTEIVPRAIGRAFGERCARYVLLPMGILSIAVWALTYPFMILIRLFGKLLHVRESLNPVADFEGDIMDILKTSDKSTELEEDEKELISSVVEFTDTIAREVMVPRVDLVAVDDTATLREIHEKIMDTGHSRLPIYHETIDNIVGIFYARDLLKLVNSGDLSRHLAIDEMHEPIFVPETKNVNDLLQEFQQKKMNVAIVVDEYGGTAGLITIKDLLEEIVGEMQDEDDHEETLFTHAEDGSYLVDAKMPIDDVSDALNISIPESSEYETVGGYIYTTLGKIPHKDEVFQRDGVLIKVVEVNDRKIHKVILKTVDDGNDSR
jgi:putative hemolysin